MVVIMVADMKLIGIVRVPIPGGGSRLKLVNQIANVNIEDELNERIRIDALNMRKSERQMMIEMNRGTANTMVRLINLLVDEGGRPGVIAVTTDTDKWVVIHFENGYQATSWFEWLNGKLY
jgi:arginine repressor